ncbi:drug:h+ antiporter [Gymnopilus junonius]|uniref:Drug:h+ antiporter n=1 Tax=Gymnopilus junonius TaxID=109634 RepID=A0A9P5NI43_GYMJU|nr:drug:h+ antiporter [Gymnopilus junonius]
MSVTPGDDHSIKDAEHGLTPSVSSESTDAAAHGGVKAVEATQKVYGKYSKWFLFIGLGLSAYIYSLDGTTTYNYLAFATSSFDHHSLISTIQVAQSIIIAVGKPVIAKIADVSSRGSAYFIVLVFYVIGYIVIASANSVNAIAGGIVLYAIGYTGLQLLTQIIIADITTLKWRGLVSGLISMPFIINAFVGSNVATNVLNGAGWRWGYGMFAILIPVSLLPLIVTLLWAEWKARKLGLTSNGNSQATQSNETLFRRVLTAADKLDIFGLLFLGTSVALILLPLTLSQTAKGQWHNGSMIAMEVIGCVLLPFYILWDFKFANFPVVARRFLLNLSVVLACLIGGFDFLSFYLSFSYLYSFVIVVKPWPLLHMTYFVQTQTVALTVFGIGAGIAMRFVHRSKPLLVVGLAIRLLGCGLMIHSRGANASDAEVVWSQILQGIGGGFAATTLQVSAQASVAHADVGMVTAIVLLVTEIGGAIGTAIAGSIWTHKMPERLAVHLPFVSADERAILFGSITSVTAYPRGDPIREGVIMEYHLMIYTAYDDVMKILTIAATAFSVVPFALSFFMPNWYLGDQQNAADNEDLAGEKADAPPPEKS